MNHEVPKKAERVPVLMYHRVAEPSNDWEQRMVVSPARFRQQMLVLKQQGYRAVSIEEFWGWYTQQRSLPDKSFVITFDDGYLDVYEYGAPVLMELGWPATVFLLSQLVGKHDEMCAELNPAGSSYLMMDAAQIGELAKKGFSFQSHSRTHADLPTLDDNALINELAGSRRELEELLGKPVPFLAYPFGRHDERVVGRAREAGYQACFSVIPGFNRPGQDPYRIRRLDITNFDSPANLLRKIIYGTNDGSFLSGLRYYLSAAGKRFPIQRKRIV